MVQKPNSLYFDAGFENLFFMSIFNWLQNITKVPEARSQKEEEEKEKIPICEKAQVIDPFGAAALLPSQLQAQPTQAGHGNCELSDAFATIGNAYQMEYRQGLWLKYLFLTTLI